MAADNLRLFPVILITEDPDTRRRRLAAIRVTPRYATPMWMLPR
jgi:hypothetical protein